MSVFIYVVIVIIIVALVTGLYQKSTNAVCTSKRRLDGQTAVVTGGTAGMGLEVAKDFADRGARVIIACPFASEGAAALRLIMDETENKNVVFKLLDLSSLKSVRKFAADILDSEKRLDILINNAGVGGGDKRLTDDGMNFVMQVNYFGHFLLTLLLLPLLKKTGTTSEPARIVSVSSILHNIGLLNMNNINDVEFSYMVQSYANSKLCLMLFAHELSKRLKGSNVVVNCIEPGLVGTNIFKCTGSLVGMIVTTVAYVLYKTPWLGAQTTIHAAVDKSAGEVSGQMFINCKLARAKSSAYDDATSRRLWDKSVSLVKLSSEEVEQCLR